MEVHTSTPVQLSCSSPFSDAADTESLAGAALTVNGIVAWIPHVRPTTLIVWRPASASIGIVTGIFPEPVESIVASPSNAGSECIQT